MAMDIIRLACDGDRPDAPERQLLTIEMAELFYKLYGSEEGAARMMALEDDSDADS